MGNKSSKLIKENQSSKETGSFIDIHISGRDIDADDGCDDTLTTIIEIIERQYRQFRQ